jgi:hypothetical protein
LLVESLPLWLLPLPVPAVVVGAALFTGGLINGLVNPALHSILTLRAPAAVRAKAMTAILTMSAAGSPFALLVAAPALGSLGPRFVLGVVAAVQTLVRILGALTGLRIRRAAEPALAPS